MALNPVAVSVTQLSAIQQGLQGLASAKPKNCIWALAKNIKICTKAMEEVQEIATERRNDFIDKDEKGNPRLYEIPAEEKGKEPRRINKISDVLKEAEFNAVINKLNTEKMDVSFHRILQSDIQEEITAGKIDGNHLAPLIDVVFVETQEEKTGVPTPTPEAK